MTRGAKEHKQAQVIAIYSSGGPIGKVNLNMRLLTK